MPSTTLHAPQVEPIQPAFADGDNEIKINYKLSQFNSSNDYTQVVCTIIDPNLSSGWGGNSMINMASYLVLDPQQKNTDSPYVSIGINKLNTLTINQYYQVQLFLFKGTKTEPEFIGNFDSPNVSLGSQTTLIKCIQKPVLRINFLNNIPFLHSIEGNIMYNNTSSTNDTLSAYQIQLVDDEWGEIFFDSGKITNNLNYSFKYQLPTLIEKSVSVKVSCVTSSGYQIEKIAVFTQKTATQDAVLDAEVADNGFTISLQCSNPSAGKGYYIQRRLSNTTNWDWVVQTNQNKVSDISFDFGADYIYRCFVWDGANWYKSAEIEMTVSPDDMYLVNQKGKYLTIAYNPQISNCKYVTQESVTNTLGGKYPIVRNSAQTGYFQFTLSGLISGEEAINNMIAQGGIDSCNKEIPWLDDIKYTNLLDDKQDMLLSIQSKYKDNILRKREIFEKMFRDAAISFLTDGQFKYFRSGPEGNKIVALTNINFTPETKLGRNIYSFSATVTEVDEATVENIEKYGFGG